ncbi:hypothetical protein CAP50_07010 [Psychrobacter sp. L7]|uniref:hypothetical protein n=1 Tax=Psychrobacter sp. L7 TaxID=1982756 RepID=UPI000C2A10F7|nr:hypothetical protein [Psychrobacter sp. L7]PJX24327.1 hypothetical protein CAP50_07010 [Psychrobacter sp. L7]
MKELSGWKRKAVLLFASEKKLGASEALLSYSNKSYADMKTKILTENEVELVEDAHKPRIKNLSDHLNKVKAEFINQPEICFYHATLIILLRRGYKLQETFKEFERLWEAESDFLLNSLSLRWIVSACDTFVDHLTDPLRSAILLNVATLVNTLKVYETQTYLCGLKDIKTTLEENINSLYAEHLTLYNGLTYFRIGTDDTLRNMRERYEGFKKLDPLAAKILLFVFDKVQALDTAFSLVKSLHKDEKSQWWV